MKGLKGLVNTEVNFLAKKCNSNIKNTFEKTEYFWKNSSPTMFNVLCDFKIISFHISMCKDILTFHISFFIYNEASLHQKL